MAAIITARVSVDANSAAITADTGYYMVLYQYPAGDKGGKPGMITYLGSYTESQHASEKDDRSIDVHRRFWDTLHIRLHEPLRRQDQPNGSQDQDDELPAIEPLAPAPVGEVAKDNHAKQRGTECRQVQNLPNFYMGVALRLVDIEQGGRDEVGGEEAVRGRQEADGDGAEDGPVEADGVEDAQDGDLPLVPVLE